MQGRVNGHEVDFENPPTLDKNMRHDIDVRIDRFILSRERRQRTTESVENALRLGGGALAVTSLRVPKNPEELEGKNRPVHKEGDTVSWSEDFACPEHGAFMPELSPRVFSFNSPLGACPECQGLGIQRQFNPDLIIDDTLAVSNGCVLPWRQSMSPGWYKKLLQQVCEHYGISTTIPFGLLDEDSKDILLHGSGSTIIHFHFESDNGSIKIDGQDITDAYVQDLRSSIGVIPQDCVLFNDTIFNNIHYGNFDATDEEVYQAAKDARIHDAIANFPEKYNTKVGERGLKLSGGEKQRIAIARAILKDAPILVCDEATSALDGETERQIIDTLRSISHDRTTIVIAHRLSTVQHADLIIVLGDGKVAEMGAPNKLLQNKDGLYYEMWNRQQQQDQDALLLYK